MHLVITMRLVFRLVRASLHAALVASISVALFAFFLLWSLLQIRDEREMAPATNADDAAGASYAMIDRRTLAADRHQAP
ncbi:MAG: hypothetical protein ABR570_03535 [Burkholderiales bacterium]